MSETSNIPKAEPSNKFQFESKLLQNDQMNTQQYLRQKIDNQINQRLQSPSERDREAYLLSTREDKPRRLLSPSSIQERLISNSYKSTSIISKNQPINEPKESFASSPIYQSPSRESGSQYKGVEQTINVNSDLGKAQREQRRREIMGKINELNEKLDQEANSRLNLNLRQQNSSKNATFSSNTSPKCSSGFYCSEREGSQNFQQCQLYDEIKYDVNQQIRQRYEKQQQISRNNNLVHVAISGGYAQDSYGNDGSGYSRKGVEGRGQSGVEFNSVTKPIKIEGERNHKNDENSIQNMQSNSSNGLMKKDEGIQSNGGQLDKNKRNNQNSIIKSEASPHSAEDIETLKLKEELTQLQSTNSSLQQKIAMLEKQAEETQISLKTQLKSSQDELTQIQDLQQKQADEFNIKMEEGDRKREIIALQMQATQQDLQEQMKDMEEVMHAIKRSYEEKLQEEALKQFDIKLNAQTEKLLEQKDEIILGLTQNNELKDIEANKMEELIEKFKDLFAQIKVEKEVLLQENDSLSTEIDQYKSYFAKLFAHTNGQQTHNEGEEESENFQQDNEGEDDGEYDQEHGQEGQEEQDAQEEGDYENDLTGEIPDQPDENDVNPEEQKQYYYLNQQQQQDYQEQGEYQGENYQQEEGDYEDEQQNIEQDYANNQ